MDKTTLRVYASFLRDQHNQSCFETGGHPDEVDTPYSAGADAIERELNVLSKVAPAGREN